MCIQSHMLPFLWLILDFAFWVWVNWCFCCFLGLDSCFRLFGSQFCFNCFVWYAIYVFLCVVNHSFHFCWELLILHFGSGFVDVLVGGICIKTVLFRLFSLILVFPIDFFYICLCLMCIYVCMCRELHVLPFLLWTSDFSFRSEFIDVLVGCICSNGVLFCLWLLIVLFPLFYVVKIKLGLCWGWLISCRNGKFGVEFVI